MCQTHEFYTFSRFGTTVVMDRMGFESTVGADTFSIIFEWKKHSQPTGNTNKNNQRGNRTEKKKTK